MFVCYLGYFEGPRRGGGDQGGGERVQRPRGAAGSARCPARPMTLALSLDGAKARFRRGVGAALLRCARPEPVICST
jgi:hypothetical protein